MTKEYVTGPSALLESVAIDGESYSLRHYDEGKIVLYAGTESGSCPYVYTFREGSWRREGHILYGFNTPMREASDLLELTFFDGRMVIAEEDPETSFLDALSVLAVSADGAQRVLLPKNPKLRTRDGNYLVLRQGERIEIEFEGRLREGEKYFATATGYYQPSPRADLLKAIRLRLWPSRMCPETNYRNCRILIGLRFLSTASVPPAAKVAPVYVESVEEKRTGEVLDARAFG